MAFVTAVMVLFYVARQGQSQPVMYLAFAVFLVVATLWVRGLDSHWVSGQREHSSIVVVGTALTIPILGTGIVGVALESSASTFLLGGAITAYVAAGLGVRRLRWYVLERERAEADALSRRMFMALGGLLGLAYGLFWLLGRVENSTGMLIAFFVVLVPIPAVVHVLSELRIRELSVASKVGTRRRWIQLGAGVTSLGLLIGVLARGQSVYVLWLVVVVVALTWALTVGSLADIAVLLAVLALMGVTPAPQDVKPAILSAQALAPKPGVPEPVVVALGDSYSSGEGATRYLDETNVAGGNQCRRAATAWPVLVAQSLGARRLVFRACSGARARNLVGNISDDEQYEGEGIQVDHALAELRSADQGLDPALVVLSIGGNDSGFRQIGSSCLSLGSCDNENVSQYFTGNLLDVEAALEATYLAIAQRFPNTPIAVMPYPDAFAGASGCARAPVEQGDIAFVRRFTAMLDNIIERVAGETGVYYVAPMRSALTDSHLALCDASGTPGLNFLDLRGVGGAALDRFNPGNWIHNSLHPNERGHAALAAAFTGWLSTQARQGDDGTELTGLAALLPAEDKRIAEEIDPPPADLPVPTKSASTLCFEKDGGDCGPQADAWALSQLAPGSVLPLLLAALVAVGAWMLAVGVSAGRLRRPRPAPRGGA